MTDYVYPLSDFLVVPSSNVDAQVLKETIAADISAQVLQSCYFINDSADPDPDYRFRFAGTLTGGEETTLDGIVAAHLGPYTRPSTDSGTWWTQHRWEPGSGAKRYIPWIGETESALITNPNVQWYLPGPCRLLRAVMWNVGGTVIFSTALGIHIDNNTTAQAEVSVTMNALNTPFGFDFRRKDNLTVDGNAVALSVSPGDNPAGSLILMVEWGRAISTW